MISEKTFIRYYSSFWEQLLPGIDNYIRMVNSGLKERLFTPIITDDIPKRRALINGMAFKLFHKCHNKEIIFENIASLAPDSPEINEIQDTVLRDMANLDNSDTFKEKLSLNEFIILQNLTHRLYKYFSKKKDVIIYPKFQGCGLLFNCSGDAIYENNLVEIKAGNTNFGRHDFYQLFTYGALNYVSYDINEISRFELFNIRTGLCWNENIENVCEIIAGTSSAEIYSEIINYVSNNYRSI
ncbi:MAG: hypothetical protein A3F72_04590 [Bacteroidetes bacterium RIFCSPLOWO2_12_FULL_35_15]|nr:MAG: hypothetical protein A3F72_04590 [Bacteroidetes bacterium RIFCSPLOWO2_12_FULL_35_15]